MFHLCKKIRALVIQDCRRLSLIDENQVLQNSPLKKTLQMNKKIA